MTTWANFPAANEGTFIGTFLVVPSVCSKRIVVYLETVVFFYSVWLLDRFVGPMDEVPWTAIDPFPGVFLLLV